MPELPEVETVCRVLRRSLEGKRIAAVEVAPDALVFGAVPPSQIAQALEGRVVRGIGRKGKVWWIETDSPPTLMGHLGMSGWIRELGKPTVRLKEHGAAPLDDESGRPKFLKLMATAEDGTRVAFTDGRRLARVWLADSAESDPRVRQLGPDALEALPKGAAFKALFDKSRAPIKALLMDQSILSGIGNWVADEALYQSGVAPMRAGSSLSEAQLGKLRKKILEVLKIAVEAGADNEKYPKNWLFHYRWGGKRGHSSLGSHKIVREQVGGRTTAWIPSLQS